MPTKRTFDLVILTVLLMKPVTGLFNMWAARKLAVDDSGPIARATAGALRITGS